MRRLLHEPRVTPGEARTHAMGVRAERSFNAILKKSFPDGKPRRQGRLPQNVGGVFTHKTQASERPGFVQRCGVELWKYKLSPAFSR